MRRRALPRGNAARIRDGVVSMPLIHDVAALYGSLRPNIASSRLAIYGITACVMQHAP